MRKSVAELSISEHQAYLEGARWACGLVDEMPEATPELRERVRGLKRGFAQVLDLADKLAAQRDSK